MECTEQNIENVAKIENLDRVARDNAAKIGDSTLSFSKRLHEFDRRLKKFDELLHKPNNFLDVMRKETEKIDVRLTDKTVELQTRLEEFETEHERLRLNLETWQSQAESIAALNSEHFKTMNKNYIVML